jgi:hypothetical protein
VQEPQAQPYFPEDIKMRSSTTLALLFTLSVASLLAVSSASANAVPTRPQSSYGDGPSYIQSTSSSASEGVTINEESFCSFSDSFDTNCALSYAYQIASPLPAGATGLTITIAVPAGAVLDTNGSSNGMGILTDDSSGFTGTPNVFYTAGVSASDLAALPSSETSYGVDGSGNSYITINDPSFLAAHGDGLAFVLDVATDTSGDPFTCGSSGTTPVCSSGQIPGAPSPELTITTSSTPTPEPGTLLSLFPALGLLGLYRRRSKS